MMTTHHNSVLEQLHEFHRVHRFLTKNDILVKKKKMPSSQNRVTQYIRLKLTGVHVRCVGKV